MQHLLIPLILVVLGGIFFFWPHPGAPRVWVRLLILLFVAIVLAPIPFALQMAADDSNSSLLEKIIRSLAFGPMLTLALAGIGVLMLALTRLLYWVLALVGVRV